jgi:DNA mismatch repair protein MutS
MSALQKEYENLRLKYPDAVIWFSINDYVESFSDCAVKTSDVLKTVLTNRPDNSLILTGFPLTSLDENLKKMIKCGYKVALVESSYIKTKNVKRAVS